MAWLFARFMTVKPASRRKDGGEGGALNVKHPLEPYGAHLGEPADASVPSRLPKTMSPWRKRRMPANVAGEAPVPERAMSPPATRVNVRATACFGFAFARRTDSVCLGGRGCAVAAPAARS